MDYLGEGGGCTSSELTIRFASTMCHTWKTAPHLEKCATFGKMRKPWKNAPLLKKFAALGKVLHTWKDAAH